MSKEHTEIVRQLEMALSQRKVAVYPQGHTGG